MWNIFHPVCLKVSTNDCMYQQMHYMYKWWISSGSKLLICLDLSKYQPSKNSCWERSEFYGIIFPLIKDFEKFMDRDNFYLSLHSVKHYPWKECSFKFMGHSGGSWRSPGGFMYSLTLNNSPGVLGPIHIDPGDIVFYFLHYA